MNDVTENVIVRLNKIEGQIRGLREMVRSKKSDEQLLQQALAVRSALTEVAKLIAADSVSKSARSKRDKLERAIKNLLKVT